MRWGRSKDNSKGGNEPKHCFPWNTCWDHHGQCIKVGQHAQYCSEFGLDFRCGEADQDNCPVSCPGDRCTVNAAGGVKEEGKHRVIPSWQTFPVSSNLWPRTSWVRGNIFVLIKPWSFPPMNLSKLGDGNLGLDFSAWLETVIFARKVSKSLIFLETSRRGCRLQFNLIFKRENKVCELQLQSNSSKASCFCQRHAIV